MSYLAIGMPGSQPRLFFPTSATDLANDSLAEGEVSIPCTAMGDFVISEDGTTLEVRAKPIAEVRQRLMETLRQRFATELAKGCESPKGRVDCDDKAVQRVTSAVVMADKLAELGLPDVDENWTMFDQSVVPHSRGELTALGLAIGAGFRACFSNKQTLENQLDAATTVAELNAVNLDSGWPT